MPKYKEGQQVRYKPVGGPNSNTPTSSGTVKKVITSPGMIAGKHVQASTEQPRYEIENERTHKSMAVYERNILGVKGQEENVRKGEDAGLKGEDEVLIDEPGRE
ncbi:hypothetical protein K469DRAFT_691541 [Zopfia rhizophila CBS 207.26]|uniref:Hypervirulence associated protein TUDOR domain-containing protein n=1 Tax=Zopfia rhizophila CBS 207.26 TaxID=1314779 RepID=A0A6A6DUS2_9PEZI|nr:hypothetical protein K469DRAFT_691541 [Zopfia rhizophila CBS 207.26]